MLTLLSREDAIGDSTKNICQEGNGFWVSAYINNMSKCNSLTSSFDSSIIIVQVFA